MIKTFNLENKVVLLTGGYGYLGKGITENLLYHNAKVYILGRNEDKFKEAFMDHPGFEKTLFFVKCTVEKTESIKSAFENIFQIEKRIDVLINNAFYSKGQSPEEMTDDEWSYGIDGTLGSVFRSIREVIPYLKQANNGKIINVSSMYGVVAPQFDLYDEFPNFLNPPHYGAAKAGVIQLTKYYASYLGEKYGIQVNSVTPGPFPSLAVQEENKFIEELAKKTSLNRIGKPEDLGGVFTFLASEAANFINGQNFIIDGGWTSK